MEWWWEDTGFCLYVILTNADGGARPDFILTGDLANTEHGAGGAAEIQDPCVFYGCGWIREDELEYAFCVGYNMILLC